MNVLVLMAGSNDSFREAGYLYPKNLVEIDGLPLVQHVVENLQPQRLGGKSIFLVREDENQQHHTADVLRLLVPDAVIVEVLGQTAGAACTALLAIEAINTDEPLLVCNGDQIVEMDLGDALHDFRERGLDGGIVVFEAVHPRWSYVKCNEAGYVVEAAEKRPISKLATAGLYWFARGRDFVQAAMEMIAKDAQVGGLFYICPAYNELILKQGRVGVFPVGREAYHSLANPRSAQDYEDLLKTRQKNGA